MSIRDRVSEARSQEYGITVLVELDPAILVASGVELDKLRKEWETCRDCDEAERIDIARVNLQEEVKDIIERRLEKVSWHALGVALSGEDLTRENMLDYEKIYFNQVIDRMTIARDAGYQLSGVRG